MGAERPRHPFDQAVLFHQRPLGIQVHHVARPVFNGRIPQPRPLFYIQFHAAGVKIRHIITGSAAAFNKVQAGILFADDQRMFKLPRPRRIQTKIGLQRNIHMHAFRHVHKGTSGPDRPVQRCELMIFWRHKLHKILFYNIFVFVYRRLKVRIDDPLVAQFFLHPVIHHFRIVLRPYPRQGGSFRFRNPQTIESGFDFFRHFLPVPRHLPARTDIRDDVVHI